MIAWTRFVMRHRGAILGAWLVLFVLGAAGAANLGGLLSNRFSVPGSESDRGLNILKDRMGDRSDGAFTLVVEGRRPRPPWPPSARPTSCPAPRPARRSTPARASPTSRSRRRWRTRRVEEDAGDAPRDRHRARRAHVPVRLSGDQPRHAVDLQRGPRRGESIAVPIALLVLVFMFGTLGGIAVPFAFAAVTIPTTLGLVWICAHLMEMAIYVTNIVALIGVAIAVDYSMLVVFRYREELARTDDTRAALETTMATAGRDDVLRRDRRRRPRAARLHAAAVHAPMASGACSSRSSRSPRRRRCCPRRSP